MITNREDFQNKYINSNYLSSRSNWNELVITKIKVEKIAVIQDHTKVIGVSQLKDYPKDVQKMYRELEMAHNKKVADAYLERQDNPNDKSKEIIDSVKLKYKNVEVIKTKDIPSFMKKHGIQVVN
jgi:hypothetical protein